MYLLKCSKPEITVELYHRLSTNIKPIIYHLPSTNVTSGNIVHQVLMVHVNVITSLACGKTPTIKTILR